MMRRLTMAVLLLFNVTAHAGSVYDLSNGEAVGGLKEALEQGANQAVGNLGKVDGFLGNERVKIPLPKSLQKADHTLRTFGMNKYADELVVTMNRAAEAAVPEARALLLDAVKTMTIDDAKGILTGGDTSATDYFRRKTSHPLSQKFLPIVKSATAKVQLAQKYNQFAGPASRWGLIPKGQANLDDYVTQKALDGLFLEIADEEKAIRANPVAQTSSLISKVFGSLLK